MADERDTEAEGLPAAIMAVLAGVSSLGLAANITFSVFPSGVDEGDHVTAEPIRVFHSQDNPAEIGENTPMREGDVWFRRDGEVTVRETWVNGQWIKSGVTAYGRSSRGVDLSGRDEVAARPEFAEVGEEAEPKRIERSISGSLLPRYCLGELVADRASGMLGQVLAVTHWHEPERAPDYLIRFDSLRAEVVGHNERWRVEEELSHAVLL